MEWQDLIKIGVLYICIGGRAHSILIEYQFGHGRREDHTFIHCEIYTFKDF